MNIMEFNCPQCNCNRNYKNRVSFLRAKRKNLKCNSCAQTGKKYPTRKPATLTKKQIENRNSNLNIGIPWNKGKINVYSDETKQRMGRSYRGKHRSLEEKIKISDGIKGIKRSAETIKKISINSRIHQLKRLHELGIPPHQDNGSHNFFNHVNERGFNFKSIVFFDIGYVADGYDSKKHIWCEFDTPYHNTLGQQSKDLIRQNNIIKHFESVGNPLTLFLRVKATRDGKPLETKCVYSKPII